MMKMLLLCLSLPACGPLCSPNQTRCQHQSVEICDANERWVEIQSCDGIQSDDDTPWTCCAVPADELGPASHACSPKCGDER